LSTLRLAAAAAGRWAAGSPVRIRLISSLCLLLLWQLTAWAADSTLLPSPAAVLALAWRDTLTGQLPQDMAATLTRVAVAFFLAMTIGSVIGVVMGRWRTADLVLDPWLILFLNIPALVTIILCYVWFGLGEAAAILAITVNKVPNVVVTLREGARTLDRDFLEMAQSFRLGRRKTLLYVVLPQLLPFLAVSARAGLALIWKIVLVVELLGRNDGIGFQLHIFFQLFDVTGILAYSLAFVLVMLVIEYVLLQPMERAANRWRR
jgi:ABC-type nitrate/sulfonate/bicarbonate transport system permease component